MSAVADGYYPETPANDARWQFALAASSRLFGLAADDPRCVFYAHVLFQSDLPTRPVADLDAQELLSLTDDADAAVELADWTEMLHPRSRGRFTNKYAVRVAHGWERKAPDSQKASGRAAVKQHRDRESLKRTVALLPPTTAANVHDVIATIPPDVLRRILRFPPEQGETAQRVLGGHADTQSMYVRDRTKNAAGVVAYTAEREALHDRILAHFLDKAGPGAYSDRPEAHFTAGTPGAGKSTMLRTDRLGLPEHIVHIDPDAIKEMLPEYQQMKHPNWTPEQIGAELERIMAGGKPVNPDRGVAPDGYGPTGVHEESSDISKKLVAAASHPDLQGRRMHVLIDGTGNSGTGLFARKLLKQQNAGYDVSVHYALADPDVALARAVNRAGKNGRWLSPQFVVDTSLNVQRAMHDVIRDDRVARVTMWDVNASGQPPPPPRLILDAQADPSKPRPMIDLVHEAAQLGDPSRFNHYLGAPTT